MFIRRSVIGIAVVLITASFAAGCGGEQPGVGATESAVYTPTGPTTENMGSYRCKGEASSKSQLLFAYIDIHQTTDWDAAAGTYFWTAQIRDLVWATSPHPNITIESDFYGVQLRDYGTSLQNPESHLAWLHRYNSPNEYSHVVQIPPWGMYVSYPAVPKDPHNHPYGQIVFTMDPYPGITHDINYGQCNERIQLTFDR